eukprot:g1362.t1
MLALQRRGLLLCLVSRNEDTDVVAAFKSHEGNKREWLLRLDDHIVARRINWSGKYENLISLSQDLNLNIADMIMVDDSPVELPQELKHLSKKKQKREMKKRWLEKMRKETPGFTMRGWRRAKRKATVDAQKRMRKAESAIAAQDHQQRLIKGENAAMLQTTKIPKLQQKRAPRQHLEKVSQHVYSRSEYGILPDETGVLVIGIEEATRAAISMTTNNQSPVTRRSDIDMGANASTCGVFEGEGREDMNATERVGLGSATDPQSSEHSNLPCSPIYMKSGETSSTMRCLHSSVYQRIADIISDESKAQAFLSTMVQHCKELDTYAISKGACRGSLISSTAEKDLEKRQGEGQEEANSVKTSGNKELLQYQEQWRQRRKLRNQVKQMIRESNPASYYKDVGYQGGTETKMTADERARALKHARQRLLSSMLPNSSKIKRKNTESRDMTIRGGMDMDNASRASNIATKNLKLVPVQISADILQDRALREAQDNEYRRSLEADRALDTENERKMQEIMYESLRLERERANSQRLADAHNADLERMRALVPNVPVADQDAMTITFRCPERIVRQFPATTTTPAHVRAFVHVLLHDKFGKRIRFGLRSSYPRLRLGPEIDSGEHVAVDLSAHQEWTFFVVDLDA